MGVTLEQYRARIGCYCVNMNRTSTNINVSPFLRGRCLNKMLMLFHLYVFFVIMLSFEMMCYNVYVPLRLTLANDVEENPGTSIFEIVNTNNTVCADVSQGNQARFGDNAGKQCVAMSLTAIVFKNIKGIFNWDSFVLNNILLYGNSLYSCIRASVKKDLLLLTDVPGMVSINEETYILTYSESLTGEMYMSNNNGPYVTLKTAFDQLFYGVEIYYECCLLTIDCSTITVFKNTGHCNKVFDSHSRDLYGRPYSSGTAVLLTVHGLENLVTFCQKSTYWGRPMPFEIKGVACINKKCQECVPGQSSTDLSANNQNSQTKNNPKRKGTDEEQALKIKRGKAQINEDNRKEIGKEDAKNRKERLNAQQINDLQRKTNETEAAEREDLPSVDK